jgi:hypothetical protein
MADTDRRSRQAAPGWAGRTDSGHFLPVRDLARIERQRPVNQQACGVVVEAGRTKIPCLTPIHVWRMPRDRHEGLWRSSSTRHSPNAVIQTSQFLVFFIIQPDSPSYLLAALFRSHLSILSRLVFASLPRSYTSNTVYISETTRIFRLCMRQASTAHPLTSRRHGSMTRIDRPRR